MARKRPESMFTYVNQALEAPSAKQKEEATKQSNL